MKLSSVSFTDLSLILCRGTGVMKIRKTSTDVAVVEVAKNLSPKLSASVYGKRRAKIKLVMRNAIISQKSFKKISMCKSECHM